MFDGSGEGVASCRWGVGVRSLCQALLLVTLLRWQLWPLARRQSPPELRRGRSGEATTARRSGAPLGLGEQPERMGGGDGGVVAEACVSGLAGGAEEFGDLGPAVASEPHLDYGCSLLVLESGEQLPDGGEAGGRVRGLECPSELASGSGVGWVDRAGHVSSLLDGRGGVERT